MLAFWCNANAGVLNGEVNVGHTIHHALQMQRHHHLPYSGELDGIATQINQNLLKAHGVAQQHRRQRAVNVKQHVNAFGTGIGRQNNGKVTHQLADCEWLRVQRHLAGFDFGEVKDVVDQPQERMRCVLGFIGVIQLLGRELRAVQ